MAYLPTYDDPQGYTGLVDPLLTRRRRVTPLPPPPTIDDFNLETAGNRPPASGAAAVPAQRPAAPAAPPHPPPVNLPTEQPPELAGPTVPPTSVPFYRKPMQSSTSTTGLNSVGQALARIDALKKAKPDQRVFVGQDGNIETEYPHPLGRGRNALLGILQGALAGGAAAGWKGAVGGAATGGIAGAVNPKLIAGLERQQEIDRLQGSANQDLANQAKVANVADIQAQAAQRQAAANEDVDYTDPRTGQVYKIKPEKAAELSQNEGALRLQNRNYTYTDPETGQVVQGLTAEQYTAALQRDREGRQRREEARQARRETREARLADRKAAVGDKYGAAKEGYDEAVHGSQTARGNITQMQQQMEELRQQKAAVEKELASRSPEQKVRDTMGGGSVDPRLHDLDTRISDLQSDIRMADSDAKRADSDRIRYQVEMKKWENQGGAQPVAPKGTWRLSNWQKTNPRKAGESDTDYAARGQAAAAKAAAAGHPVQ